MEAPKFKEQYLEVAKKMIEEGVVEFRHDWRTPWMYTDRSGVNWFPFTHGMTKEAIEYIETECEMPRNISHHSHAIGFPQRVRITTDGGLIIAHAILFPDGRRWDAYNRKFEQVYKPWKEAKDE